jgi:DNA-binding CsgD family transcriptional regulator
LRSREGTAMRSRSAVLNAEERDVLLVAEQHPKDRHLSNSEIGQRLGVPAARVKTLIHEACVKLGAHTRNEAILFATKRGEISVGEMLSLDELAALYSTVHPEMLRRIALRLRQGLEVENLAGDEEQLVITERGQDGLLTNREREVLILAAHGLTNKEIASFLCMSVSAVRTFLNRACTKLDAPKRADAVVLALKKGEISIGDVATLDDVVRGIAPLGPDSIEKIARLLEEKRGKQAAPPGAL